MFSDISEEDLEYSKNSKFIREHLIFKYEHPIMSKIIKYCYRINFVHVLMPCGFCSELINLIKSIIFAKKLNYNILINDNYWNFGKFDEIFQTKIKTINSIHEGIICYKSLMNKGLFKEVFNSNPTYEEMSKVAKKLFILQPNIMEDTLKKFSNFEFKKKEYIGVHIRRGDKITSNESKNITKDKYINEILNHSKIQNIVICTDDTEFSNEVIKELLTKKNFNIFIKNKTTKGYDQSEFNNLSSELKRDHLIDFLNDIQILINSKIFICTFSSNVSRFIALFRNGNNYSLDIPWFNK